MAKNLSSAVVSATVGALVAFLTCFVFFYFFYERGRPDPQESNGNIAATPAPTRDQEIPNPEIKAEDIKSASIKTVYKEYFEAGDKCAKTYDEYFGKNDGVSSLSSPCTIEVVFDRDGNAKRSIEVRRWDKIAKDFRVIEKSDARAHVTPEQFASLAQSIVINNAFKDWRDGMSVTVSNCSITAVHSGGTRTVMSNVDENTTVFLQMINAFKKLERELTWEKM